MKKREAIWFWLIAISLMVFSMCVLSLQIIDLHQESDLKKFNNHSFSGVLPKEKHVDVKTSNDCGICESFYEKKPTPSRCPHPHAVAITKVRTPKMFKKYDRELFDVPHDGRCGFWALLIGKNPNDELIHASDIIELKKKSAKTALRTDLGPSRNEIRRMFCGNEVLDTSMLPYISKAMNRDIIASNNIGFGFDLFTDKGETFHYDEIEEISKEAENRKTIWLHNINNAHWMVAIAKDDDDDDDEKNRYCLMN